MKYEDCYVGCWVKVKPARRWEAITDKVGMVLNFNKEFAEIKLVGLVRSMGLFFSELEVTTDPFGSVDQIHISARTTQAGDVKMEKSSKWVIEEIKQYRTADGESFYSRDDALNHITRIAVDEFVAERGLKKYDRPYLVDFIEEHGKALRDLFNDLETI